MLEQVKRGLCALSALFVAIAVGACGDDGGPEVVIVSPEPGAMFTLSDDLDPATDGVQIDVQVSVPGVDEGEEVWLYTDADRVDGDDPTADPDVVGDVGADGMVTLRTTLYGGVNQLIACVDGCDLRSRVVTVTVVASCGGLVFLDPAPVTTGDTVLSSRDDIDGEPCGAEFTTNVRVSTLTGDGTELQLSVNGAPGPMATVAGGEATFEGVVLGNRGDSPNTLSVSVMNADEGISCTQDYPSLILVRCDGVSCAITTPDAASGVLNSFDDVSDAPGFQADFEVTSDLDQSGSPVRLIVDGVVDVTNSTTAGSAAVAQFGAIDLAEGRHSVVAECLDSLGNVTRTAPANWLVDTVGCEANIETPAPDTLFVDTDDQDPAAAGIQIETTGTIAGDGCVGVSAGPCGSAGEPVTLAGNAFSGLATLGTSAMQDFCVYVEDDAGNIGEARVPLQVRTEAPQLVIQSPVAGTSYNQLGGTGFTADLEPASDSCEIAMTVLCTDEGNDVAIVRTFTGETLGTAECVGEAGLPAPYTGRAVFDMLEVPSLDDGSDMDLVAEMTVDRLVGTSVPITITPDCAPPDLEFFAPTCGEVLRPSEDDADPTTPEFDYLLRILNPPVNNVDRTTVTIFEAGSTAGSSVYMGTSDVRAGQVIVFDATFSSGGELEMQACATDPVGNTGCFDGCAITVADLARVSITSPANGSALNLSDDCSADPGLQIEVTGTTDAPDSATATVDVGSLTGQAASITGGVVSACVDAQDGSDVVIRLNVTTTEGTASAQVSADIDSQPPTEAIDDLQLAAMVDRRGGIARFSWTAVADADGTTLETTEIRCAAAPITTEADWTAATVFYSETASSSPGSVVTTDVTGFPAGTQHFCAIRSYDLGMAATPLAPSVEVSPMFEVREVQLATAENLGLAMASVGDVDGDFINDFVSTGYGEAYLFFGRTALAGGTPLAPDVVITGGSGFGGDAILGGVQPVGDVNADGVSDFIIGSPEQNSAYVFFGRSSRAAWTGSPIAVSAATCPLEVLCIRGEETGDFLGTEVGTAGDFNGDGIPDVAIGAVGADGLKGVTYVVLGSASYGIGLGAEITSLSGFAVRSTTAPAEQFIGASFATPGSVDMDSRADLFIGATGSGNLVGGMGIVKRLDGRTHPGTGMVRVEWDTLPTVSTGVNAFYAANIRAIGDIDNGGEQDIGIYVGTMGGFVEVLTGETDYTSGFSITNDLTNRAGDSFGVELAQGFSPVRGAEGDLNQDGAADLLIGAWETGTAPGDVRLWYAPISGATVRSSADVVFTPEVLTGAVASRTTNFIGDVNGDGYPDLAVGEPDWPEGSLVFGGNAGRLWIYY